MSGPSPVRANAEKQGRYARLVVAAVACVAYVVIARGALNLYPFSVFGMYSKAGLSAASRIIAVDPQGRAHEIDELDAFACDRAIDTSPSACAARGVFYYNPSLDLAAVNLVSRRRGAGANPIAIVRRIYRFDSHDGRPREEDCVLAQCRANAR